MVFLRRQFRFQYEITGGKHVKGSSIWKGRDWKIYSNFSFDAQSLEWELKQRLPETFPEFIPYLDSCRFAGCQHVKEKGCAVLEAVRAGKIPESRHRSYVRLYEELKPLKEWHQHR